MAIGAEDVDSEAAAADYLYGLAASEFVATRNELVKRIRAGGDRELANKVKAMRKPSTLAAQLNHVLRQGDDEVESLLRAALALREGHSSMLAGELADLGGLQTAHRSAAAQLAEQADQHREQIQTLLEATSLDSSCHDSLRKAAYVAEPQPTIGFDLFTTPTNRRPDTASSTDGSIDHGATVSSISDARVRRRERNQAEADRRDRVNQRNKQREAAALRAEIEATIELKRAADDKAAGALELADRQLESRRKRQAKAQRRVAEARTQLADAEALLGQADEAVTAASSTATAAQERREAAAEALRNAETRLNDLDSD